MSRRPNLRITSREKAELQRLTKNAKAKSKRIEKQFDINVGIDFKKVSDFTSRAEVNAYKKQLESFTNRHNLNYQYVKNKHGQVFTKKEVNEIIREEKRINRRKVEERKKYEKKAFKSAGKPTGITVEQRREVMRDDRYSNTEPVDFKRLLNNVRDQGEFKEFLKNVEKAYTGDFIRKRNELYRENYKKALFNVFGMDASTIISHVENIALGSFMDMYYEEDLANIAFIYDKVERDKKLQAIKDVWGI